MIKGAIYDIVDYKRSVLGWDRIELIERRLCSIRSGTNPIREDQECIWLDHEWVILVYRSEVDHTGYEVISETELMEDLVHYELVNPKGEK